MEKESKLWGEIKEDLRRQGNVGEYGFESYISQLKLKSDTGTKLVLEYPADMFIDWVETYYSNDIRMSAARVLDTARELEYVPACADCPEQAYNDDEQEPSLFTPALSASCNIPANTTTDRKHKTNRRRHNNINSGLNSDYTFDSFVVGSNSEFAVAAAKAVVNAPAACTIPSSSTGHQAWARPTFCKPSATPFARKTTACRFSMSPAKISPIHILMPSPVRVTL